MFMIMLVFVAMIVAVVMILLVFVAMIVVVVMMVLMGFFLYSICLQRFISSCNYN